MWRRGGIRVTWPGWRGKGTAGRALEHMRCCCCSGSCRSGHGAWGLSEMMSELSLALLQLVMLEVIRVRALLSDFA